jgi:uncharacterized protein YutE (UPF0331/DUF86 family)
LVDKALVLRKLGDLDGYLKQLEEFANISIEEYRADWKTQRIVERTLQIMLEICVDIANHIISDETLRIPKSYGDTFLVLKEAGVLNDDTAATMREMAKFRNILVHGYDKLDEAVVVGILSRHLSDFIAFREAILDFLRSDQAGS